MANNVEIELIAQSDGYTQLDPCRFVRWRFPMHHDKHSLYYTEITVAGYHGSAEDRLSMSQ